MASWCGNGRTKEDEYDPDRRGKGGSWKLLVTDVARRTNLHCIAPFEFSNYLAARRVFWRRRSENNDGTLKRNRSCCDVLSYEKRKGLGDDQANRTRDYQKCTYKWQLFGNGILRFSATTRNFLRGIDTRGNKRGWKTSSRNRPGRDQPGLRRALSQRWFS